MFSSTDKSIKRIEVLFSEYNKRKKEGSLYSIDEVLPARIILEYLCFVKKPYFDILDNYKYDFINNESYIDNNLSIEEGLGVADVYEYLMKFDYKKEKFDFFMIAMEIHKLLFDYCAGADCSQLLRTDTAIFNEWTVEVPTAQEAMLYLNSFINNSDFIFKQYNEGNYMGYIRDCIKFSTIFIYKQPFSDGNKRTARAILNLLLKKINIPPVYIEMDEADEYKRVLKKAIEEGCGQNDPKGFNDINQFYLYKICDSIIKMDINKSKYANAKNAEKAKLIMYENEMDAKSAREEEIAKAKIINELMKNNLSKADDENTKKRV